MSLLLLLLTMATYPKVVPSHIVDMVKPYPIVLNRPLTLNYTYSFLRNGSNNKPGLKNVTVIQITKLFDIGHIDPSPQYKFAVSELAPNGNVSVFAGRSDIHPDLRGFPTTKAKKQRKKFGKDLAVIISIPKATCSDIGMVQFLLLGVESSEPKDKNKTITSHVYLDTGSHRPTIDALIESDSHFVNIGSRLRLNCSLRSTVRNVTLKFKFKLPHYTKFKSQIDIENDAKYSETEGLNSSRRYEMWPKDEATENFALVPGPCPRVAFFHHWITLDFKLSSPELIEIKVICLATKRPSARTDNGDTVSLEIKENISISLSDCVKLEELCDDNETNIRQLHLEHLEAGMGNHYFIICGLSVFSLLAYLTALFLTECHSDEPERLPRHRTASNKDGSDEQMSRLIGLSRCRTAVPIIADLEDEEMTRPRQASACL